MSDRQLNPAINPFKRSHYAPPLRANFYADDKVADGLTEQQAVAAVLGTNNQTNAKGIIAGSIDQVADVGIGGRSDGPLSAGVYGYSENGTGVYCKSNTYEALHAETMSGKTAAIAAYNMNPDSHSAALYAKKYGLIGYAALFDGDVQVEAGNLNVKSGQLQINGQSVWDMITDLQQKLQAMLIRLAEAENRANAAFQEASRANTRIDLQR